MSEPEDVAVSSPEVQLQVLLRLADPATGTVPQAAAEAAGRAAALAARLGRPLDQGRAGAWRCSALLSLGRHAEVLAAAPPLLPLLAHSELADERCELLRVLALAASETGAFDQALDAAHELVRITATLGEDGASLNAAFALAACLERMGDTWQAVRVLSEALGAHGGGAHHRPLLMTLNALCAISIGLFHRLKGAATDDEVLEVLHRARAAGQQAHEMLEQMPDPVYEVAILGNLGEVLLHLGELDAAQDLLRRAHAHARQRGLAAYAWRVETSLADAMLARGHATDALAAMRRLVIEMGERAPQHTAIRAHDCAYRACRALGRFEEALAQFETAERLQRQRTTSQLRAQSRLLVTRTETQQARRQADEARRDAAEFAERAERDPLTGLGNRRHLARHCAELLPASEREGRPLALALIDLDHFKRINDEHGHAVGDQVLVVMAQLLRENTRAGDVLARQGGEEFVVVLPGMTPDGAAEACERLRERVAAHPWHAPGHTGHALTVTISIGLAATPPFTLEGLLNAADAALYGAKRGGRNRLMLA